MPSFSLLLESSLAAVVFLLASVQAVTSSVYELDTEFSGPTFFNGFDFFTVSKPTVGLSPNFPFLFICLIPSHSRLTLRMGLLSELPCPSLPNQNKS